ncbi:hypothetical protein [Cognatiyoonia sp. IB215182]|uniref:hypothetical protein n=1 Tax=Cognatiyoonia sp. IB215182 TaxID=3097353 RepID=UPI002A247548|nr:hypothetical protein [Cognatiyoonia sp. IB215182]
MLSTQLIDVVWSGLVLAKVEKVEIDKTATPTVPLRLSYMPYSHGLFGALTISGLASLLTYAIYPDASLQVIFVIFAVGFSHWLLDLIVHDHDMPLIGNRYHVGFGLWRNRPISIALEVAIIICGAALLPLSGAVAPVKALIVGGVLTIIQVGVFFSSPPETPNKLAVSMLMVFALMTVVGIWMDT